MLGIMLDVKRGLIMLKNIIMLNLASAYNGVKSNPLSRIQRLKIISLELIVSIHQNVLRNFNH